MASLTIDDHTLAISPGDTILDVTMDATYLEEGVYYADVVFATNDPANPVVVVPVTMTVLPIASMGRVSGSVSDAWTSLPLSATTELVGVHDLFTGTDRDRGGQAIECLEFADGNRDGEFAGKK